MEKEGYTAVELIEHLKDVQEFQELVEIKVNFIRIFRIPYKSKTWFRVSVAKMSICAYACLAIIENKQSDQGAGGPKRTWPKKT